MTLLHRLGHRLHRLRADQRLLLCLTVAAAVFAAVWPAQLQRLTRVVVAWDAFCVTLLALHWIVFFSTPAEAVRTQAQQQDESRSGIFVLVLSAVCASLLGILLLMRPTGDPVVRKELHRAISLLGIALSWNLLHTLFTVHYAHRYYTDPDAAPDAQIGGLDFPGEKRPDYLDFAYFSFIIGMTFQVSDVSISARPLRRFVLLHSLLSFVFNTIVVALTISVLSNLGK